MKLKISRILMAIILILGIQACHNDDLVTVKPEKKPVGLNTLDFTATNLTVDDGELTAEGGAPTEQTWTITTSINGEVTTISGTKKSNELPVRAGDEIEITFKPSATEQTEATFSLPDGTSQTTTTSSPTFKWTIPENFTSGMEIKGESQYETESYIYTLTGSLILIDLK